jgi:hypothetical protein
VTGFAALNPMVRLVAMSLLKKAQIPVYNQKPAFRSNGPDLRQDE